MLHLQFYLVLSSNLDWVWDSGLEFGTGIWDWGLGWELEMGNREYPQSQEMTEPQPNHEGDL